MLSGTVALIRTLLTGMLLCAGLLLGPFVHPASWGAPSTPAVLLVMALAAGLPVVLLAWSAWWVRRQERDLRRDLRDGAGELWGGAVRGPVAPGRVEYSAPARHGDPAAAVCLARAAEGPRRVVTPVPDPLPRGTPVVLVLHPGRQQVAVLDDRGSAAAAVDGRDPAWASIRVPGRVAALGGWVVLLVLGVVGLALGAAVSLAVLALVP